MQVNFMKKIFPIKKLKARIQVPGSKYVANRALILAALAEGKSIINNVPINDDIENAIKTLEAFGVVMKRRNEEITIMGGIKKPNSKIDVGESGTLMRFSTALAALVDGEVIISGSERIQERPVGELLKSLNDLGVDCELKENPPIKISGKIKGGKTKIDCRKSSQFLSALLIISPLAQEDVEIKAENLVSESYVNMTIKIMKDFGVKIEKIKQGEKAFLFKIKAGQKYKARLYHISSDWSSANYFFAAAAIIPGEVVIDGLEKDDGEGKFVEVLKKVGCEVSYENKKDFIEVKVRGNEHLSGIEIDMSSMPDSVQTLAAVACFASEKTIIKNIAHLKHKESDRIKDTVQELRKLGVNAECTDDEITILPSTAKASIVDSHNDHRMGMSLTLIGLKKGITIKNPEAVNKSFPEFWNKLKEIGAVIEDV